MDSRLRGESTPRLEQKGSGERHSHDTNMQNTLGYDSTPRIEKKCSGENILGLVGSTPCLRKKGSGKAPLILD